MNGGVGEKNSSYEFKASLSLPRTDIAARTEVGAMRSFVAETNIRQKFALKMIIRVVVTGMFFLMKELNYFMFYEIKSNNNS
jgi:hypothetical protein